MTVWNDEMDAALRAFWREGHSASGIGLRMGMTKNSIVGRSHRLDLPARPSPIIRTYGPAKPVQPPRVTGPTLPAMPSEQAAEKLPVLILAPPSPAPVPAKPRPSEVRFPDSVFSMRVSPMPKPQPIAPRSFGRVVSCLWPIGEPGTRGFRFCDVPSEPNRPYCADHVKIAYVHVRDRREDAA